MKKNLRKCPYCGSAISYFRALTEISSGEHICPECSKYSNIIYSKKIYICAGILLVAAIVLAAAMFLSGFTKHILLKLLITLIPFGIFFFMIPLYYGLVSVKSEALKPTIKKSSQEKEKMKYIKYNSNTVQLEESSDVKNTGSFKDKFQKFVKTYIIVDDDDDDGISAKSENKEKYKKNVESEKIKKYNDGFGSFDDDILIEESFDDETEESVNIENIEIDNEYSVQDNVKPFSEEDDDVVIVEEEYYNNNFKRQKKSDNTALNRQKESNNVQIKNNDLSTKKVISPESNAGEKQNDRVVSLKKDIPVEDVEVKASKISETISEREPVYHKYTKTDKVDYVYFPECADSITYVMMKDPEPIIDEEEQENEEILNFFDSAPSAEEEEEFGKNDQKKIELRFEKKIQEVIDVTDDEEKNEEKNVIKNDVIEFEYYPESKSVIFVKIEEKTEDSAEENDNNEFDFSESADEEMDDIVVQTPSIISDDTMTEDYEQEFDFDDDEDDTQTNYDEYEVVEKNNEIPVTTENHSVHNDIIDYENSGVIRENVEDDENDVNAIKFGQQFDEIFEPVPYGSYKKLSDDIQDEEVSNNSMKLVSVSQSEPEDEEFEDNEENEDDIFDEEDGEYVEGSVEYIPETKSLEKTKVFSKVESEDNYVVDYSEEKENSDNDEKYDDVFEEDDDEEIDFSGYQTSSYTEDDTEDIDGEEENDEATDIDDIEDVEDVEELDGTDEVVFEKSEAPRVSKYEKKFPKAAQAAVAMTQNKPQKTLAEKEITQADSTPVKHVSSKKSQGFFSAIRHKLLEATEEERREAFEQEEEERRRADKEARRKAKERAKADKDKINSQVSKKKIEKISKDDEVIAQNYKNQEKIVIESVRKKADSITDNKLTNKEKARIIAQREAGQKEKIESQRKAQKLAELNEENERLRQQKIIKSQNSEKAEALRIAQVRQAQKSQAQLRSITDKRNRESVSLKGGKNVRSKVSQNSVMKRQQLKNNFTDRED